MAPSSREAVRRLLKRHMPGATIHLWEAPAKLYGPGSGEKACALVIDRHGVRHRCIVNSWRLVLDGLMPQEYGEIPNAEEDPNA